MLRCPHRTKNRAHYFSVGVPTSMKILTIRLILPQLSGPYILDVSKNVVSRRDCHLDRSNAASGARSNPSLRDQHWTEAAIPHLRSRAVHGAFGVRGRYYFC